MCFAKGPGKATPVRGCELTDCRAANKYCSYASLADKVHAVRPLSHIKKQCCAKGKEPEAGSACGYRATALSSCGAVRCYAPSSFMQSEHACEECRSASGSPIVNPHGGRPCLQGVRVHCQAQAKFPLEFLKIGLPCVLHRTCVRICVLGFISTGGGACSCGAVPPISQGSRCGAGCCSHGSAAPLPQEFACGCGARRSS